MLYIRVVLIRYVAILQDIGVQPNQEPEHDASVFRQIMGLKLVHLMAFFILIYVGAEVTIGECLYGQVFRSLEA